MSHFRLTTCTLLAVLGVSVGTGSAVAGEGAKFGARDPRTCPSQKEPIKGTPTAAQFKSYFICDNERVIHSGAIGDTLNLVSDVVLEVGKGRPFNQLTDSVSGIDPSQTVYPIRGSYVAWMCTALGQINGAPGKNCMKGEGSKLGGTCYKDSFGDWHCSMCCILGSTYQTGFPPPTGN